MAWSLKNSLQVETALDTSAPISSTIPRWQRKALQGVSSSAAGAGASPSARRQSAAGGGCGRTPTGDRFIPNRAASSTLEVASAKATVEGALAGDAEGATFHSALAASLLVPAVDVSSSCDSSTENLSNSRVLAFRAKAPAAADGAAAGAHLAALYTHASGASGVGKVKSYRHVPSAPERILDAPALVDDYYLKLLDWSCTNTLAVALGPTVYCWNGATGAIQELCTLPGAEDYVTAVAWIKEGGVHLAVGTAGGDVQLWDAERARQIRSMRGHSARVGALDWNAHTLSSGSRDTSIINHDVRIRDHHVATLQGHNAEVCGLKWSPDGALLASGANDNALCIWDAGGGGGGGGGDARVRAPRATLTEHQAAVKALAWCPWQKNVLASGGGTADRSIKVWNAATGALLSSTDTGSQVCSLQFNPQERELLSSHGFSQNQLCLWKFPTMSKLKELTGHTARVLHTAVSPDGSTVCSAAADETLRFWRVFGEGPKKGDAAGRGVAEAGASAAAPAPIPSLNIR
jgi:cell division cycle protein 20 (cofactor of APC complex)